METATFILDAVQTALLIVGGVVLGYFFKQYAAAKEAENSALRAQLDLLKGFAAPNLAAYVEDLSRFADRSAKEIRILESRLNVAEGGRLAGISTGLLEGAGAIRGVIDTYTSLDRVLANPEVRRSLDYLMNEFKKLMQMAGDALDGKEPKLFGHAKYPVAKESEGDQHGVRDVASVRVLYQNCSKSLNTEVKRVML